MVEEGRSTERQVEATCKIDELDYMVSGVESANWERDENDRDELVVRYRPRWAPLELREMRIVPKRPCEYDVSICMAWEKSECASPQPEDEAAT